MVTVYLVNDNIRAKVPSGATMRQVATKTGSSMEFGCRVGDCGTCVAHVEKGMDLLSVPNEKERKLIEIIGGDLAMQRLMCQAKVEGEKGEIIIKY